jgi:hypothetical protein
VFLLGQWKNYDELEESLCFDELLATINAMRERERRDRIFFAALQGVDLDDDVEQAPTAENDIVKLNGYSAMQEGFGIGMGLGYMEVGE